MSRRFPALALAVALLAYGLSGGGITPLLSVALAADAAGPASPPGAAKSAATHDEASTTAPAPDYSREAQIVELMRTAVRFEDDGTSRREVTMRFRVQSEAGVQQLGQLVFGYSSASEALDIDYVRVTRPDGSTVTAPSDAVQDLSAPIAREAPIYTDFRQKHITVPGLRPGETLEVRLVNTTRTPLAPGHFWYQYDFERTGIVLDEQLEVDVPRDRALKIKTRPGLEPVVVDQGDRRMYRWASRHVEREEEETKNSKDKKKRKSDDDETPAVQLTTFQTWEALGKWYGPLARERATPDAALKARALELTRDRKTDLEKIEALYDFVAKNFRYVSLSFGLGRFQPHAAADVFANQYGDCKDKHTLLAAMLEAIGLHAWPVLINSERKIDPDVPSPSQFDHVFSVIPVGKELVWVDTTTEVAPFRLLSPSLRDKQALVIARSGPAKLVQTPADPPFTGLRKIDVTGRINDLGRLSAHVSLTLRGDLELMLRVAVRQTPQNQWPRLAEAFSRALGLPGEVAAVRAGDPSATREPFTFDYDLSRANYLNWSSKSAAMRLPIPTLGWSTQDVDPEADAGPDPIRLGSPVDTELSLELELPARYTLKAPVDVSLNRDYATYRSSYRIEGTKVNARRALRFTVRELPPARNRDLYAFLRATGSDEAQQLSIESTGRDAPPLPGSMKGDELYEAATAALTAERYPLAIDLLKRVTALEPTHRTAWNLLGLAYMSEVQLEPAIQAFKKQLEVNPFDEHAYDSMGRAYLIQRKYAEAEDAFRRQIELTPLNYSAHFFLGRTYTEWRRYDQAVAELEKASRLTDDDPECSSELGRAYLKLGRNDEALAALEKAVSRSRSPATLNDVAYHLASAGVRLDRAREYAEASVAATAAAMRTVTLDQLTPADLNRVTSLASAWDTLGYAWLRAGDLDRAERFFRASWQLMQNAEVGDHLGQVLEQRGRKAEAAHMYALALASRKPEPETRGRLAALVGEKKIDAEVERAKTELAQLRVVPVAHPAGGAGEAELFISVAPGPKIAEVKFIHGDEALKTLIDPIRSLSFPLAFPDDTPTRAVLRGSLSCPASGDCRLVLQLPEDVRSVD